MKKVMILAAALAVLFALTGCKGKKAAESSEKITVGVMNISMESEYWASLAKGAELFAQSKGLGYVVMSGDTPQKQIDNVESFINQYGSNGIIFLDPNNASVTPAVVEMCEEAGVKLSIYTTLEKGLYPTDFENFVLFLANDNVEFGYQACVDLFKSIGGKGKVAELYGIPGNDAAAERNIGMKRALDEFPEIELVDSQIANYLGSEGMVVMENWIAKYGDELKAVFCHSDGMAVGAAEALKNAGMVGKINICGFDGTKAAFECIKDGSMYSTMFQDGYAVGGYGAAYAWAAKTGKLDVKTMDQKKRMFFSVVKLVTAANVDEMIATYVDSVPTYDFDNLDFPIVGIIPNPKL
ncbi:MAG: sugar ABC transporter substrate-binding protein [Treponema sp.]|jgi:ABC-type sugar transport system substrate-binding protein|nr:sugar ABC transporter substrate-binding protein [Treponema sp.]